MPELRRCRGTWAYCDGDCSRCTATATTQTSMVYLIHSTADVPERNVGKWIEYNYPGAECVYCSKCKEEYYPDDLLLGGNDYPNYCPHCRARMRERSEE